MFPKLSRNWKETPIIYLNGGLQRQINDPSLSSKSTDAAPRLGLHTPVFSLGTPPLGCVSRLPRWPFPASSQTRPGTNSGRPHTRKAGETLLIFSSK